MRKNIFTAYLATLDLADVIRLSARAATDACLGAASNQRWLNREWGSLPVETAFELIEARKAELEGEKPTVFTLRLPDGQTFGPAVPEVDLDKLASHGWSIPTPISTAPTGVDISFAEAGPAPEPMPIDERLSMMSGMVSDLQARIAFLTHDVELLQADRS